MIIPPWSTSAPQGEGGDGERVGPGVWSALLVPSSVFQVKSFSMMKVNDSNSPAVPTKHNKKQTVNSTDVHRTH